MRDKEKHQWERHYWLTASCMPSAGELTCNLGLCPDLAGNQTRDVLVRGSILNHWATPARPLPSLEGPVMLPDINTLFPQLALFHCPWWLFQNFFILFKLLTIYNWLPLIYFTATKPKIISASTPHVFLFPLFYREELPLLFKANHLSHDQSPILSHLCRIIPSLLYCQPLCFCSLIPNFYPN